VALTASGCGFIAKDGPSGPDLRSQAAETRGPTEQPNFVLLYTSPDVIRASNAATFALAPRFGSISRGGSSSAGISKGDVLAITVFEAEAGGLFLSKDGGGSRQGNYVQIPNQQVDDRGEIAVPYGGGSIKVAGLSAKDVGRLISERLTKRAIEPQAVVSVVEKHGNDVSVLGDVSAGLRFSLDPGGTRLLGAIARAGGPKNPAYETTVSIQRDGVIHKAWMSSIVTDPSQNVAMRSGDVVYVAHEQRVFMVLGATPTPGAIGGQNNRRFPLTGEKMSLAEALANAGGLDSLRADPKQVFLLRYERKSVLEKNGVDVGRFGEVVPTVYALDMSQAPTFFMANSMYMRDKDVVFIADAAATDTQKFLNLFDSLSTTGYNSAAMYVAAR
jgi:polysaccharide export outer membrane protein